MSPSIPPDGAHARCVRAAIDGLTSIEDCRQLGLQAAGFVAAAGGVVIDHEFLPGPTEFGLRLWAARQDVVTFAAGMRASLRCLVDRPGRLRTAAAVPRVVVNVALSPPADPLSPAVLDQLEGNVDPVRLVDLVCRLAEGGCTMDAAADLVLLEQAMALLQLRPAGVPLSAHLRSLQAKFGLVRLAAWPRGVGLAAPPDVAAGRMDS